MRLLWIGEKAKQPKEAAATRTAAQVPSLFSLGNEKHYDVVLLDCRADCPWSLPHILAAAAELAPVRLCLLAGPELQQQLRGKLPVAERVEDILAALNAPQPHEVRKAQNNPPPRKKAPLWLPEGVCLVVDVVGSQPRMGVTTQCVQLWHFFSGLGRRAAIVLPAAQLGALAPLLEHRTIPNGILVEDVPLVTVLSRRYDCFIRDRGCLTGAEMETLRDSDLCILVAGTKPWELLHTARALERLGPLPQLAVILSFCSADARPLLEQMGYAGPVVPAPWQPEPFVAAGTEHYDQLSAVLEQQLAGMAKENGGNTCSNEAQHPLSGAASSTPPCSENNTPSS